MIAGMAITSFAKMKGLQATAIAWAAFCIPTSIMIVFLSGPESPARRERIPPATIAIMIISPIQSPRRGNSLIMVSLCCRKNIDARSMSAGKESFPSHFFSTPVAFANFSCTPHPNRIGTSIITMFWANSFPTGRCICAAEEAEEANVAEEA